MRQSAFSTILLAVIATVFLISGQTAFADPNLISHWAFEEGSGTTANDSAGSNNGSITKATWTTGQIGGALSFDGYMDYVTVGDKADLEQQAFTLSFWARLDNPSGSRQGGIAKGWIFGVACEYSYRLDFNGGNAIAGITNTSNAAFNVTDPIVDADWHMWSMTAGAGTVTLYKDGAFVGSTGYTGTIDYTKNYNSFVIGARSDGSYAFDGKIDDVRFYNKALSAGEIGQLYEGNKAFSPNPADGATGVDPNVVLSWWPGKNAASHDVYLGTDYDDVNDANTSSAEYVDNFDVNTWDPYGLEVFTTYYWRIDEVNDSNLWKGYVWSFETDQPEIGLSETQFEFYAIKGEANPDDQIQILGISNIGAGTLNWQISEDCNWLSAEPNTGSSTGEVDDVNLSVDISSLAIGIYTCELTVSDSNASNNPQTVDITLEVHGTLYVPSEYPTIQDAIDAALYDDVVVVEPGIYTGIGNRDLDFGGKEITVRSENGPESCTIDCNGSTIEPHRGFYFHSGEGPNSIVSGLTITNGYEASGGGIYCSSSSPKITSCIIAGNTAGQYGGGMYGGTPTIVNCTIIGNSAVTKAGGLYGCKDSIVHCIIRNNTASGYPQLYDSTEPAYSCVQDWTTGTGNIDADPCFVGPGNYHLLPTSPCIDAGNPLYKALGLTDIDGQPRVIGARMDMGADEYGKMIVVTSPVQGEIWATGSKRKIEWTQFGVTSVDILLSTDAGENWQTIAEGITGVTNYLWELPNHIDSNQCMISVLPGDGDANVITIDSELFTIKPYPHRPPVPPGWLRKGLLPGLDLSENKGPELGCVKWIFDTNSPVSSQVAVTRSHCGSYGVYITCENGLVYALDDMGELFWNCDINTPIVGSPAVGYYWMVYVAGKDGRLYALDDYGDLRWTQTTDAPVYSTPVVGYSGKIYVSSEDGLIYAFGTDGSDLWTFETKGPGQLNGAVLTTPVIEANGTVYVTGFYDPNLYALDANTGSVKWACQFDSACDPTNNSSVARLFAAPAIGPDGTIYQTLINDPNLYAIDPCTGNIIWATALQPESSDYCRWPETMECCSAINQYTYFIDLHPGEPVPDNIMSDIATSCDDWHDISPLVFFKQLFSDSSWSPPAVGPDGTIYVSFDDPYLRAVEPNGTTKWITQLGMVGSFTLSVDRDGFIYAASDDGFVCVVNPEGKEVSHFKGSGLVSFPAIAEDGTLIVSDSNNKVWAITDTPCESQPPVLHWLADVQPNWTVNFLDFAILANNWLDCADPDNESCGDGASGDVTFAPGDFNRDTYVDFTDLIVMVDQWLMGTN